MKLLRCTATILLMLAAASDVRAQRPIVPFATGALLDHRVSTTDEVERVAGAVWGAGATVTVSDWLGVRGRLAGGTLSARTEASEGRTYTEGELALVLTPDRWVTFDATTTTRTMATALARQRWMELRAGGELGLDLIDGVLRGTVQLSIAPWVSVSGHPGPDLAIGTGTGLQYTGRRLTTVLTYSLDRYDFPASGNVRRLEQRSMLTARIGWRLR